ncbi:MAG TPA: DUF2231 domain-containing protein [Candidatus Nanopelagicales bacterium]|nr:DUF2231 domain-containing protein [Candidatus Nanopelagicales bacterium]
MGSVFDTIFGLPTHVLIVHATVVLLPVAALGAVVVVLRRALIHKLGLAVVIVSVLGAGAAWIARLSGAELASRVGNPQPHVEYGHDLPIFATVFAVLVIVYWLFARGVPANRSRPWWVITLGVAVLVASVAVTWSTVITGHSGSEAVWGSIIENTERGQVPDQ